MRAKYDSELTINDNEQFEVNSRALGAIYGALRTKFSRISSFATAKEA